MAITNEEKKERVLLRYYKNRKDRILYQRKYDSTHRKEKRKYDKKRRLSKNYNRKKLMQHFSRKYHFPVLIKRYNCCQICGSKKRLEIHHIKYTKRIKDVLLLCQVCHKFIHRKIVS